MSLNLSIGTATKFVRRFVGRLDSYSLWNWLETRALLSCLSVG